MNKFTLFNRALVMRRQLSIFRTLNGEQIYRLHIGRTWTAFYDILEIKKQVRIVEISPIDEAHEKYSY